MDVHFYKTRWFICNILDQRRIQVYLCEERSTIFKHTLDCSATFEIVRSPGGESRLGRRNVIDIYLDTDDYGKNLLSGMLKRSRFDDLRPFYQCMEKHQVCSVVLCKFHKNNSVSPWIDIIF